MKKLAIIAMALITLTATAQRVGEERGERGQQNLSAEEVASLQTKRMTLALVLSDVQIKKVHKINLEQAEKRKAMREARNNKKGDAKSENVRFAQRKKLLDERIAVQNKMKDILDEEQFTLWRKMSQRMDRGKGRRAGKNGKRKDGKRGDNEKGGRS